MTYLIGNSGVVKHGNLRIWAERGMIRIEDARDNSYVTVQLKQFLFRIKALNDAIGKSSDSWEYADERRDMQRLVEEYVAVAKRCYGQGEPENKDAIKSRKRSRTRQVSMPKSFNMDL
jgi:hypothetical protein